jgi:hypothetical protein
MTWSRQFRSEPSDFTRAGPLNPELLVTLLLFMAGDSGRRGYGQLLDAFWSEAQRDGIRLPQPDPVSAAAFCNARKKLRPGLFEGLLSTVCDTLETNHRESVLWHGRRVFAVDGCRFNLQRSPELADAFGVPHGGHCPQALVSTLYDVIGGLPYAATIAPGASCERQEFLKLLPRLRANDIVVLDRGYPSLEVLEACIAAEVDIVVRVPKSGTFEAMNAFVSSGGDDYRLLLRPGLEVRAVRIDCAGEEPWFLLTSLRRADVTLSQMGQLYHLRWTIEEFFKLLKSDYFTQRQFHAKSAVGVEQEVRTQLLFAAIARLLAVEAAEAADVPLRYIVTKSSVLALAEHVVRLFLLDDRERSTADHSRMLQRVARLHAKRRPNRSCPRRSFKPGPRWNSKGKVGG